MLDALCLGKVGEFATFGALCDDESAVKTVAQTEAAWRLVEKTAPAIESVLSDSAAFGFVLASGDDAVSRILTPSMASMALGHEQSASVLLANRDAFGVAVKGGCMSLIAKSSELMGTIARSATALNVVVKSGDARAAWMESEFAHDHYDALYETLHNADESMFAKVEQYYETAYSPGDTGYIGADGLMVAKSLFTEDLATSLPPVGVVTLLKSTKYGSFYTNMKSYSLQTKKVVGSNNFGAKRVFMGGFSFYASHASAGGSGTTEVYYASYLPL